MSTEDAEDDLDGLGDTLGKHFAFPVSLHLVIRMTGTAVETSGASELFSPFTSFLSSSTDKALKPDKVESAS